MEKVLDKSAISHQKLRNRIEAIEMDSLKFRDKGHHHHHHHHHHENEKPKP